MHTYQENTILKMKQKILFDVNNCILYVVDYCRISVVQSCNSNPCKNGATCVNGLDNYYCVCDYGWSGNTCDMGLYLIICFNYFMPVCKCVLN